MFKFMLQLIAVSFETASYFSTRTKNKAFVFQGKYLLTPDDRVRKIKKEGDIYFHIFFNSFFVSWCC